MKSAAVICEYNPMHEGHREQLRLMRRAAGEDAALLCLMSGDYVQRGEPAIRGKYDRARAAIDGGADLVLELPYPWSCAVAEHFASGALSILRDLCCVDRIFFGSEGKSAEELTQISRRMNSGEFRARMAELRRENRALSHPKLRDRCYADLYGASAELLPNEILGVEYISASEKLGCTFALEALPMLPGFGAGAIRKKIAEAGDPDAAFLKNGERALLAALLLCGRKNRFSAAAARADGLASLFAEARNAGDTDARLRRQLLATVLISDGREKEKPAFTVLLAANGRGKALLARMRKCASIPIVTKRARAPQGPGAEQFALYLRAQDLYPVFMTEPVSPYALRIKKPYISGQL